MSARTPAPLEAAAPSRSIALPAIDPRDLAFAHLLARCRLPAGVRGEIARAAHETLEQLAGPAARSAFALSSGAVEIPLGADDLEAEAATADVGRLGFELVRGRRGVRVVRSGPDPVWRNGWLVGPAQPATLRDGDVVATPNAELVARYRPPLPRPFVEVGPARRAPCPPARGFEFAFVLEPCGEPLVLRCDAPSGRALLDVALGGDGSAPFDPTAVGEIDRAVVEWIVRRFAHHATRSLFDADAAVRATAAPCAPPEWWVVAAARVGAYHGVWWLGTTENGLRGAARLLAPRVRPPRVTCHALSRVDVWVAAHMTLGRVTAGELATVGPGDLFVSRSGIGWRGGRPTGEGSLVALGADAPAVRATIETGSGRCVARLGGLLIDTEGDPMQNAATTPDATEGGGPFEPVLDGIGVSVGVEIARRRMSLAELLALAPGDVVELEVPVRNIVMLLIDGSPFARGELVDVGGALGVRVVALGGRR